MIELKYILIIIFLITIIIITKFCANEKFNNENFYSEINHDYKLSPHHIKTSEFNRMISEINYITYKSIYNMAYSCLEMNGNGKPSHYFGNQNITLQCYNDDQEISNNVINKIHDYIQDKIKEYTNVNIQSSIIYHDLHKNLNLKQKIIYPLKYSGLYAKHKIQYVTSDMIKNTVIKNIDIKNILMTIISRRGIVLVNDSDNHYY
jgi:transcriptional regulator NrdR family protein